MLCLRPEGTAAIVRALLNQNRLQQIPEQRLWYIGPLFRRERPQKGRYRQFYQLGVEALGFESPGIEIEQILMVNSFWKYLGLDQAIQLEINTLGNATARVKHRAALIEYYEKHLDQLDEEAARRLRQNPLRILDSKIPATRALNANAPKLLDFLEPDCKAHFSEILHQLDALSIGYHINPCLVRGLDYYTRTVFEWTTQLLGAQGTVCAGGRYDPLISSWGGPYTPACGFAIGIDRIALLYEAIQGNFKSEPIDFYWITTNKTAQRYAWQKAAALRALKPNLKIIVDCDAHKFKQQFKRADRAGATWACIIGDTELADQKITLKHLRQTQPQQTVSWSELKAMIYQEY